MARDLEIFTCIYDTCTPQEAQGKPQWAHSYREFDNWWVKMEPRFGRGAEWTRRNWTCSSRTLKEAESTDLAELYRAGRERKPWQAPTQCHLCGETAHLRWNPVRENDKQMQPILSHIAGHFERLVGLAITSNTDTATLGHLPT